MCRVVKACLCLFLFGITVQAILCKCVKSFMMTCDSFEDIKNNKDVKNWSELIIGSDTSIANESVHLMKILQFQKYHKLTTLIVIQKINRLELTHSLECNYRPVHLNLVSFYGNQFNSIQEYQFPVVKVKKFSLVNNQIETIKGGAFDNHDVEIFDISDNSLEVIESNALPRTKYTKTIIARNNKLNFIERESFPSGLRSLHLDHNNLRHLPHEAVGNLEELEELTLSHNKFKEIPDIAHMQKLIILDLSQNAITSISKSVFQNLNNLRVLDLSYNLLTEDSVLSSLLSPNKQPKITISLIFNRLEGLNLTNVSFNEETILLFGNPWDCQTWDQMLPKLLPRQSECDKKSFSSGVAPYCINFKSEFMIFHAHWYEHIDRFVETIKKNQKSVGCDLVPEHSSLIDPIDFGCVS